VKWFVEEEGHLSALGLLEQNLVVIAPDLIFSETANVLWKKFRRGEVTAKQAERVCRALPDFFQGVVSAASLIGEALELATRLDHPVYDCVYLACAQQHGAKLVTADGKFVSRLKAGGLSHLVIGLNETAALTRAQSGSGLAISDEEVNRILALHDQFERTLSFVEERVARPIGGGTLKWVNAADLAPAFDSPSRRRLEDAVSTLPHENLADLIALAWLGRGFDGDNWTSLRDDARGMLGNDPLQHLGYMISLMIYVEAGIQKISDFRGRAREQTDPEPKQET